jgi:KRAB domain-containing zinc finger protein
VHCGENRGSSVENIYEHNLKHVNIRPFVCKLCGDSFLRNQQFVEHEKSHDKPPEEPVIKESKYKCKTCLLSFSNWKLFYKHQQESGHFSEKFLCEICGSEFHSNFLLSQHIRRLHKRTGEGKALLGIVGGF